MKIEFRGQDRKIGKWVYGDLLQFNDGSFRIGVQSKTWTDDGYHNNDYEKIVEVKENTISQFIGKMDVDGKKIYRGDVVSYIITTEGIEDLGIVAKSRFIVDYDDDKAAFVFKFTNGTDMSYNLFEGCLQYHKLKVLGNIYNDPQLLNSF